jgi:hypothetical protein
MRSVPRWEGTAECLPRQFRVGHYGGQAGCRGGEPFSPGRTIGHRGCSGAHGSIAARASTARPASQRAGSSLAARFLVSGRILPGQRGAEAPGEPAFAGLAVRRTALACRCRFLLPGNMLGLRGDRRAAMAALALPHILGRAIQTLTRRRHALLPGSRPRDS